MERNYGHDTQVDIHDPSFYADPYPAYDKLRNACPVMPQTYMGDFNCSPGLKMYARPQLTGRLILPALLV